MSFNIRGSYFNFPNFIDIYDTLLKCISTNGLCETKTSSSHELLYNINNFTAFHDSKKPGSGGGSIYVRNNLYSYQSKELRFSNDFFQNVFVKVIRANHIVIVGMIYRQPDTDVTYFHIITVNRCNVYLMGDWNLDSLKSE